MLVYPCLDFTLSQPSHRTFADGHYLTRDLIHWFMRQYLGPDRARDEAAKSGDPELSPLLLPKLSGLFPPSLLVVAEADPLADDGRTFARRMQQEEGGGAMVELVEFKGVVHGFFTQHDTFPEARQAMARVAHYLNTRAWLRSANTQATTPTTQSSRL